MAEISQIDQSILDVLQASRVAAEQEIADHAQLVHDKATVQDASLTLGGLIVSESVRLREVCMKRDQYLASSKSWLVRRKYDKEQLAGLAQATGGVGPAHAKAMLRHMRSVRAKKGSTYICRGLFPQYETTDVGEVTHQWAVKVDSLELGTYYQVTAKEYQKESFTKLHQYLLVSPLEVETEIREADMYFSLGLVMEAIRQVRASMPVRVSKKW